MQSPPANVEMAQRSLVEAALAKGDFATPATLDHELYDAIGAADTKLRSLGASGISALRSLLDHESPHVRMWVASSLLRDGDDSAKKVLEDLALTHGIPALNAKVVLEQYAARLHLS